MKKNIFSALLCALAIVAVAACNRPEEKLEQQDKNHTVTFEAQVPSASETKTALMLKVVPDWRNTDVNDVHIFETETPSAGNPYFMEATKVEMTTPVDGSWEKAYFYAEFDNATIIVNPPSTLTKAGSTFAYTSIMATRENDKYLVPSLQQPHVESLIDPKADFLIGKCSDTYSSSRHGQRVFLEFLRPVALSRLAITNLEGSYIESVKINCVENTREYNGIITGEVAYSDVDFETSTADFQANANAYELTMKYPDGLRRTATSYVYMVTVPGTKSVQSVEVVTDKYIYTKTYATPASLTFYASEFINIAMDMTVKEGGNVTRVAREALEMEYQDAGGQAVSEISYDLYDSAVADFGAVAPTLYIAVPESAGEITFSSSNEDVATVDENGDVTLTGIAGEAVITASATGDGHQYMATTASYKIIVTNSAPEVTYYKSGTIDAGYEYMIVSAANALRLNEGSISSVEVTVDEEAGTVSLEPVEGILWTAAAISADLADYGTHSFSQGSSNLTRYSESGSYALVASDEALDKYMAWNYDGTNFWNISIYESTVTNFYAYFNEGWRIASSGYGAAALYTTRRPQAIAFGNATVAYDIYDDASSPFTGQTVSEAKTDVTYSIDNSAVATIDPATGAVEVAGKGVAVITATAAASDNWQSAVATYTLNVTDSTPVSGETVTIQLEPATELVDGEEYYLVSNGKVLVRSASDAVAADFDATEVSVTVSVDLAENLQWTLGKNEDSNSRGNEYQFTNGGYYFGVVMDKTTQSTLNTYTYYAGINDDKSVATDKSIQDHNIDLANGFIYYKGNSKSQLIHYDTTSEVWDTYEITSSSFDPATFSTNYGTSLYVKRDMRQEQTVNFIGKNDETVTSLTYDLASEESFVSPELSSPYYGDVTYSTDDANGVITLDEATGAVTINKKGGPVTITATVAGNTEYKPATASYTLTVTNSAATPEKYYKASVLESGYEYVIVSNGQILKSNGDNNDVTAVAVEVSEDDTITLEDTDDILWSATDAPSTLTDYGTHVLSIGSLHLLRKSNGSSGSVMQASSDELTGYMIWGYSDNLLWNYSSNGSRNFCVYYSDGWKVAYQNYSTAMLFTNRPVRDLSFSPTTAIFDMAEEDVATFECPALNDNTVEVTYSSSDESVVKVDATTGKLTEVLGTGTVTIKATAASTAEYQASVASYTLTVKNGNVPTLTKVSSLEAGAQYMIVSTSSNYAIKNDSGTVKAVSVTGGDSFQYSGSDIENLIWEATSSNEMINAGQYIFLNSSSLKIDATKSGTAANNQWSISGDYVKVGSRYVYYSNSSFATSSSSSSSRKMAFYKIDVKFRNLAFDKTKLNVNVYQQTLPVEVAATDVPALSGHTDGVSYSCSDPAVTVASDGALTINGTGTFTITASAAASSDYRAGSASYTLNVVDKKPSTYYRITSTDDLEADAKYIIVHEAGNKVFLPLEGTSANTFWKNAANAIDAEINTTDHSITSSAFGDSELTLETGYYLKTALGPYIYPKSDNSLSAETTKSNALTISFETSGVARLFVGNYTIVWSTSSSYFSSNTTSSTSATGIYLYKLDDGQPKKRNLAFSASTVSANIYGKTTPIALSELATVPTLTGKGLADVTYSIEPSTSTVAEVTTNGVVTVKNTGSVTIKASAPATADYQAGEASYTLTVVSQEATTYTKTTSISVDDTYLIVSAEDDKLFNGVITTGSNALNITPDNGVITDSENAYSAYEFTLEKDGDNYYIKFNDGKYLVCNYTSGDTGTGLLYVSSKTGVTYPYTVSISNGAVFFNTTQANNSSNTNQYLYYKTETSGSGPLSFKIGQSGSTVGVHLYKKN